MTTAGSTLATRLFAALRAPQVANQAGVVAATWASTTVPRVFRGLGGFIGGRNRGRCPFLEFDVQRVTFDALVRDGGMMTSQATIRAHVAVGDLESAANLTEAILCASLAVIRGDDADNYLRIGSEDLLPLAPGPWGHSRDVVLRIEHSFDRTYEITT